MSQCEQARAYMHFVGRDPEMSSIQSSNRASGIARFLNAEAHSDPYAPGVVNAHKKALRLDEVVAMASVHFNDLVVGPNPDLMGVGAFFE